MNIFKASDVAGEISAAMAAASIIFKENGDVEYANKLLTHAFELYTFGTTYRGTYSDSFPESKEF